MALSGGDTSLVRRINCVAALRALLRHDRIKLRDLALELGVSRNTAEDAASTLVRAGFADLVDEGPSARSVGRPARHYALNPAAVHVIGIDVSVDAADVLVADLRGNTLHTEKMTMPFARASAEDRLEAIRTALPPILDRAHVPHGSVQVIGIATTGIIDQDGHLLRSSRVPQMEGTHLTGVVFLPGVPTVAGNDARLNLYAEQWRGAAQDVDDVVAVVVGRRITGAVMVHGKLLTGHHGAAGEIGSTPASQWAQAFASMADWDEDPGAVFAAAREGDAAAIEQVAEFAQLLARDLASMVATVDPQRVIVAGGLARAGETILEPIQRELDALTLFRVPVVQAALGHEAVALGAVRIALDLLEQELFDPQSPRFERLLGI